MYKSHTKSVLLCVIYACISCVNECKKLSQHDVSIVVEQLLILSTAGLPDTEADSCDCPQFN